MFEHDSKTGPIRRRLCTMAAGAILAATLAGCGGGGPGPSLGGGGGGVPPDTTVGKGLNYVTGNGMDQLNCDSSNSSQITSDMALVAETGAAWVRVEASPTAASGLPATPTCDASALEADAYSGIRNLVAGVRSANAQPLVNILGYHYDSSMRAAYLQWLDGLLAALPDTQAFELGNEPNLANSTEGWTSGGDMFPYGWSFNASDFSSSDATGVCPTGAAATDFSNAVASYVAWLADSYAEIKARRPGATVILGGLASWQPQCFAQLLDQDGAATYVDAGAYHPYGATPQDAVATLDLVWPVFEKWGKRVWITEFGYNSAGGASSSVSTEGVKAQYLADSYAQLTTRLSEAKLLGPVVYYTTRDEPLKTAQWISQCQYVTCQASGGSSDPAQIAGTALDVSGFGLFEWLDGHSIVAPAYAAFVGLK